MKVSPAATRRPRRRGKTPEGAVLAACLDALRTFGFPAFRMNSGLVMVEGRPFRAGFPGISDILAIVPESGRWLAIECKRPGGRVTAHQSAFLATIVMYGGVGVVIADVAVLCKVLAMLKKCPSAAINTDGEARIIL